MTVKRSGATTAAVLAVLMILLDVVVAGPATAVDGAPRGTNGSGVSATAHDHRPAGRLSVRVSGRLLGQAATVVVRGVGGPAQGVRRVVRVTDSRDLRPLPTGRYRVRARVITAPAARRTNPLLRDYPRTSAASVPLRRVTVRCRHRTTVRFRFPPPPRFPANFTGRGRYIVRDLGVDVPFRWNARHGDMQMVAGGPGRPIHFVNLIKDHVLYTKTYRWPGVAGVGRCLATGPWDRRFFNQWFASARYVGPVTLEQPRHRRVDHWRAGLVFSLDPEPGNHLRVPLASADIFVQHGRSSTFWNVQHFGVQNLLDPQLDEWIQMRTFEHRPGRLDPPADCRPRG